MSNNDELDESLSIDSDIGKAIEYDSAEKNDTYDLNTDSNTQTLFEVHQVSQENSRQCPEDEHSNTVTIKNKEACPIINTSLDKINKKIDNSIHTFRSRHGNHLRSSPTTALNIKKTTQINKIVLPIPQCTIESHLKSK